MNTFVKVVLFLLSLGLFNMIACKKRSNFDKEAILSGIINEYLVPSYQQLLLDNESLELAGINFQQKPTITTLEKVQNTWKIAMKP